MAIEPGRQFTQREIAQIQALHGFAPQDIKYDRDGYHVVHEDRGYRTVYRGGDELEHTEAGDTWPPVSASQTGDFHGMTLADLVKHHDEFVDDHTSSPEYLDTTFDAS